MSDPDALVFGKEPILREGEIVGRLTSASYGWTAGRAIGLGYVKRPEGQALKDLVQGNYTVMVSGKSVQATVSIRPFYDPKNERMRS